MSESKIVAAVEIGTTKVAVLIGEIVGDSELNIIGHSICSSKGVKKGVITDLNAVSDCVHATIMTAEKKSRRRINEVYLSLTGNHIEGKFNIGMANVSSSDKVVQQIDMDKAKEDATGIHLPEDRVYIHYIRNSFSLDGHLVEQPISRKGERVQVGYWSVNGDKAIVEDYLRIINGIGIHLSDMIISSIASGAVLLEDADKEAGALVVDIGGGTTDWVLYRNGFIVRTGVVPVGGDHITNDLSSGLRIHRKSAEAIKIKNGRAYCRSEDRNEGVWLFGDRGIGDCEFPMAAITKVIEARVTEIFQIIKESLEEAKLFSAAEIVTGVILTGGTSRLEGIDQVAGKVFGLEARRAEIQLGIDPDLRKPEYSTALGLLHYALTGQDEKYPSVKPAGFFRRVMSILNFD